MASVIGTSDLSAGRVVMVPTPSEVVIIEDKDASEVLLIDFAAGPKGDPAPNVELRTTTEYLQYRLIGDADWTNLIGLDALVARGASPTLTPGIVATLPPGMPAVAELIEVAPGAYTLNLGIPAGAPGRPGQPRFSGIGPPQDPIVGAQAGDQYLDTDTGYIYELH